MSHRVSLVLLSAVLLLLLLSLTAAQSPPATMADVRITSITGCVDVYPVTVNCSVSTNTLRITTAAGFPFKNEWDIYTVYVTAEVNNFTYFTTSSPWPDVNDPTNTSIFVNITASAYYPHITGALVSVWFTDWSTYEQLSTPPFAGFSYRFEGPPILSTIGGCEGSGQATLNCVPDSAVIELTGSGLLWYASGWGVALSIGGETSRAVSYYSLRVANDTYATLSLDWIYKDLLKPQHYAGVLLTINLTSTAYNRYWTVEYSYTTNSLHISFVPLPRPVITYWYVPLARQACIARAVWSSFSADA